MGEPEPGPSSSATKFSSPMKKRPKKTPLSSKDKHTVINVYKYVEKTFLETRDEYPVQKDIVDKVTEITGTSQATVYRILKERRISGRVESPPVRAPRRTLIDEVDDLELGGIRRKVHQFYFNNEPPTINKVLEAVNDDDSLGSYKGTTLYKLLMKLQFKYSKRSRKSVLIDRDEIVLWRVKYLSQITKFRNEGKKIYYTDETWLNEGHTKNKVWHDESIQSVKEAHRQGLSTGLKNPSGKGKRLIILHIGSDTGFLDGGDLIFEAKKADGDYHSEMDAHNFEKWFTTILPKLEPNSVIVMDNAPYHSRRQEKIPTSASKKGELQKWLTEKNIPFDSKEVKAQLYEKIKKEKSNYTKYVVDEMAKEQGITVVRLPPYHCELNPIELIWAQVKGYVAKSNKTFKLNEVKSLLAEALNNVTADDWKRCINHNHVIKEEAKMTKIDGIIDEVVDRFVIEVGSSSSDSSDYDDE